MIRSKQFLRLELSKANVNRSIRNNKFPYISSRLHLNEIFTYNHSIFHRTINQTLTFSQSLRRVYFQTINQTLTFSQSSPILKSGYYIVPETLTFVNIYTSDNNPQNSRVVDLNGYYTIIAITRTGIPYSGPDWGLDSTPGTSYSFNFVFNLNPPLIPYFIKAPNQKNAIRCLRQSIVLLAYSDQSYRSIRFLALSVNGAQTNQTFTVDYTDFTTDSFIRSFSDWASPSNYSGEINFLSTPYRNRPDGGTESGPFYVYEYVLLIDPTKRIKQINLPNNIHIFILSMILTNNTHNQYDSLVFVESSTGSMNLISPKTEFISFTQSRINNP